MCSFVRAEPRPRGCGARGNSSLRRDPQRFLFDALEAALQRIGLPVVHEIGEPPLVDPIDAGTRHASTPHWPEQARTASLRTRCGPSTCPATRGSRTLGSAADSAMYSAPAGTRDCCGRQDSTHKTHRGSRTAHALERASQLHTDRGAGVSTTRIGLVKGNHGTRIPRHPPNFDIWIAAAGHPGTNCDCTLVRADRICLGCHGAGSRRSESSSTTTLPDPLPPSLSNR